MMGIWGHRLKVTFTMMRNLGTLADCLTWDSRCHTTFRAFLGNFFLSLNLQKKKKKKKKKSFWAKKKKLLEQ